MQKRILALVIALLLCLSPALALELTYDETTGTLVGAESDWLIDNLGDRETPRYVKIAQVTVPEGLKDLGGLKSDPLEQNFFLVAADEHSFVDTVLILYMPGKNAKELAQGYGQYQNFLSMTDVENTIIAGHDVHMRILLHDEYDYNDQGEQTNMLGFYLSCAAYTNVGDGALMVAVFTKTEADPATLPTQADLLILLETLYGNIEIDPEFT